MKSKRQKSLLTQNPAIEEEWHPTRNGEFTPRDVSPSSHKKAWWICQKGHEWEAVISSRNRGAGCPYCSGRLASTDNCLSSQNPKLAEEWHPTRNRSLTPRDVTLGSETTVWWICKRGHEWQAKIYNRKHRGCPYCAGRYATQENNLAVINPVLAKELHPDKNGPLSAYDLKSGSSKKVWWICKRGHEWQAVVSSRNQGSGCPYCISQTSQLELRMFTELRHFFEDAEHRKKIAKFECDIYIPSINIGIEIDGTFWHQDRFESDMQKTVFFQKRKIDLIRVREKGLRRVGTNDVLCERKEAEIDIVGKVLKEILILRKLNRTIQDEILQYLQSRSLVNDKEYLKLLYTLPSPFPGKTMLDLNPDLAKEWHPQKNGTLTPNHVSPTSNKTVWWICSKGHEWKAKINNRYHGAGCPFCSGRYATSKNCLAVANPELAKEWHPTENNELTPNDVTPNSGMKIFWLCKRRHKWLARVADRNNGRGCPYCSRKAVNDENCLAITNPELTKEWHPVKNGNLTPQNILAGTAKKVWWICERGHEWQAIIAKRSKGKGCPYCAGRIPCNDNCLQTNNPSLAGQWHPTKNDTLTAYDVTPSSTKKVWWVCQKGHEWEAIVGDRNRGNGCPYCAGRIPCGDNCLAKVNPELTKEWHPVKNGNLTPQDVTHGGSKKVWWICPKGHEWQAAIYSRSVGNGCPVCAGKRKA
jgi:very-short-patch-repair endonuclease